MWSKLTPSDQARFLATTFLSVAFAALALAFAYAAYQVGALRVQIPELLTSIERTSQKVEPVLRGVEAIRDLVPPILKEVKATRELVPGIVAEVQELRKTLPPLVDTSAQAINNVSAAVRVVEPRIPSVLAEVRATREALPGILDRANQVVDRASSVGQKAGEGAVKGVIGGIVGTPFRLIGDVGKGLRGILGLDDRSGFTAEDERLASVATDAVLKNGKVGAQNSWKNPDSTNHGSVALSETWKRDDRPCVTLRHRVEFRSAPHHQKDIYLCQQPDGFWQEAPR